MNLRKQLNLFSGRRTGIIQLFRVSQQILPKPPGRRRLPIVNSAHRDASKETASHENSLRSCQGEIGNGGIKKEGSGRFRFWGRNSKSVEDRNFSFWIELETAWSNSLIGRVSGSSLKNELIPVPEERNHQPTWINGMSRFKSVPVESDPFPLANHRLNLILRVQIQF